MGAEILAAISEVAASTGSACHSGRVELSSVLRPMGVAPEVGMGAIRFSLGRTFLEYLVSEEAQQILADGNNEYPVAPGVEITGPMAEFTDFRASGVNASVFGTNAARAVAVWDRAGVL